MLLDGLYQEVEKLTERIGKYGPQLRNSEALTRYALIDPLLRALDWDTEDPALVMPEYKLGNGFADYALLLNGGKPAIVIEAKKLGEPLGAAASQGINYCITDGIKYFAATDGRNWDLYETHRPVPITEKKIVSLDITAHPSDVCLKALALWRRSVQNGIVLPPTQLPQIDSSQQAPRPDLLMPTPEPDPLPLPVPDPPLPSHGWLPLTELKPEKGGDPPPEIRFPDGSTTEIRHWKNISEEIVRWLDQQGKLDETCIPVQASGRSKRYIVSGNPSHPRGKEFTSPEAVGKFYVETNWNSKHHAINARTLIEKAGTDVALEQFSFRLS